MPRPRKRVVAPSRETRDRRRMERWIGSRTLEEAASELGKSKQWLSAWFQHRAQIQDLDVDRVARVTGIPRRVLLDGRVASRKLAEKLAAAA